MLVRIGPKLDVCEGHRRVGKRIHHLPREKRVGEISLASRSDRSSELGVEEPRRQAPKLIAEGENFAKKAFRRYKKD